MKTRENCENAKQCFGICELCVKNVNYSKDKNTTTEKMYTVESYDDGRIDEYEEMYKEYGESFSYVTRSDQETGLSGNNTVFLIVQILPEKIRTIVHQVVNIETNKHEELEPKDLTDLLWDVYNCILGNVGNNNRIFYWNGTIVTRPVSIMHFGEILNAFNSKASPLSVNFV